MATAVRGAAMRQNSLAPLFADLAVAVQSPALPEAVRQAAGQVLALRLPIQDGLSAATLKQAFQRSGLFLESRLADDAATVVPADDLKAALGVLRQVLKVWLDAEPNGKGATTGSLAELHNAPPLVPGRVANAPLPAPDAAIAGARRHRRPIATRRPRRSRSPCRCSLPTWRPTMPAAFSCATPRARSARQTLLQAASVPDRAEPVQPHRHIRAALAFRDPVRDSARARRMAQFEIARDGRGAAQEGHQADLARALLRSMSSRSARSMRRSR